MTVVLTSLASSADVHAAQDDGAISLKTVLPAPTPRPRSKNSGEMINENVPTGRVRLAARPLTPVPDVPHLSATDADAKTNSSGSQNRIRPRSVLLTSGQDDAATIMIPELVAPPESELAQAPETETSAAPASTQVQTSAACNCQQCQTRRSGRKRNMGQRIKGFSKRVLGCFIEVEECQEVHFDVDDYPKPILLIAASSDDEAQDDDQDEPPAVRLLSRKLTDIQPTLAYAFGGTDRALPANFFEKVDHGVYEPQVGPKMVLQWEPTNLWYYPLYFQDPGLERYGHTRKPWVQPFVSTGRFLGQAVGLPYQMTLDPPHCPQYTLGYYQPGEWAPKKKYQIPWNEEAAATQFLWMTGLFLLVP